MSGSNQGPLATRLKVPKGRKDARKMVGDMINRIKTEPSLPDGDRLKLTERAMTKKAELEQRKQPNKQKTAAIGAAVTELEKIGEEINAAIALRGEAFAIFNKDRGEHEKNSFIALRKEVEKEGIRPEEVPVLKDWGELCSNTQRGIMAAQNAQAAVKVARDFQIPAARLSSNAGLRIGKVATDLQAAKKKAQDTAEFKTLMEGIAKDLDKLEVLTGNIDQGSLSRAQEEDLNKRYGPRGGDNIAEGVTLAKKLRKSVDDQLRQAGEAGENALAPLLVRFEKSQAACDRLKQVKTRSLAEETGFDIDLPYLGLTHYWPLVDDKITLIQRCFDEKMPASGAPFIEAQLDEFDKMLEEVKNFHKGDDAKLGEAIDAVNDLVQRKRYLFFDTDLQKYMPNEAKVLNAQFNSIDKDCKSMKPLEILKHLETMKAAAENANKRAAGLKKLCEVDAAGKLADAKKELEGIVKELAKLPEDVRDGHKTFHGDYRQSVDELSAALKFGAEGPDENKIRTLMARLATQLAELKPGGKLDSKAIGDSHTAGCKSEADEKQKKEEVEKKKKEVKLLYKEVEGLVDKADPGDDAELKAIERLLKEVNDSAKGMPPEKTLERYDQVETRLNKLKNEPRGMAVLVRGRLPDDYRRFDEALGKAEGDLKKLLSTVSQAYNGEGKDDLINLINQSINTIRLPAPTIEKATGEFVKNMAPEQLPGRLKARETGLSGVRQYQKLLDEDAVLSKLAEEFVFGNAGIGALRGALNSLELNLLRGI